MIPAVTALTISSARSAACGFSILAITGTSEPEVRMRRSTGAMSSARRTNEIARRSMPLRDREVHPLQVLAPGRGQPDLGAGQVEALMRGDPAARLDLAAHRVAARPRGRAGGCGRRRGRRGRPPATAPGRPSQATGTSPSAARARPRSARVSDCLGPARRPRPGCRPGAASARGGRPAGRSRGPTRWRPRAPTRCSRRARRACRARSSAGTRRRRPRSAAASCGRCAWRARSWRRSWYGDRRPGPSWVRKDLGRSLVGRRSGFGWRHGGLLAGAGPVGRRGPVGSGSGGAARSTSRCWM